MEEMKDKKEIVITGSIVSKWACRITIVVVIIFAIITLARGATVAELFTEYWVIWIGFFVAVMGAFFPDKVK